MAFSNERKRPDVTTSVDYTDQIIATLHGGGNPFPVRVLHKAGIIGWLASDDGAESPPCRWEVSNGRRRGPT
jgi:hypothetical protein